MKQTLEHQLIMDDSKFSPIMRVAYEVFVLRMDEEFDGSNLPECRRFAILDTKHTNPCIIES